VAVKQISGAENIRLRIPDRSTRCLMAMLVALSTLIDMVLLFELVNVITAGRPIRPAICATLLAAGLPLMADQFSRRPASS
jgi:hypothetical protein